MIRKRKIPTPALLQKADKAMKSAVRKLIREKRQKNEPLIIWENGRVRRKRL